MNKKSNKFIIIFIVSPHDDSASIDSTDCTSLPFMVARWQWGIV